MGTSALLTREDRPVNDPRPPEQNREVPGPLDFGEAGGGETSRSKVGRSEPRWGPLSRASCILSSHLLNIQATLTPKLPSCWLSVRLLRTLWKHLQHSQSAHRVIPDITASSHHCRGSRPLRPGPRPPPAPHPRLASCSPTSTQSPERPLTLPHRALAPPDASPGGSPASPWPPGTHPRPCPPLRPASSTLPCGCLGGSPASQGWWPPSAQMLKIGDRGHRSPAGRKPALVTSADGAEGPAGSQAALTGGPSSWL